MINSVLLGEAPLATQRKYFAFASGGGSAYASAQFRVLAASHPYESGVIPEMTNVPFAGTLTKALRFDRSIVTGAGFGKMSIGVGELELVNTDGAYDDLINRYAVDGRKVVVRIGRLGARYDRFKVVYSGTALGWDVDEDVLRVALRDSGYLLQVPASANLYGGTGGLTGGVDLKEKRKPLAFGSVDNVSPPLVDPAKLLFQVHDGSVQAISAVYDRGSQLTFNADYPTADALQTATVPGGSFATCLMAGFFRLGAAPAGTVTADVRGDTRGGTYASTTGAIIRRLIARSTTIVDPDGLVVSSFALLDEQQPAEVGYWVAPDSNMTVRAVLDELLGGIGAWGDFRRDGMFQVARLDAPAGQAYAEYDQKGILNARRIKLPAGLSPPPWRTRCAWGRVWTVQTDLAGTISADRISYLAQPFRTVASSDPSLSAGIKGSYLLAQDPEPVQSYFKTEASAQEEADRLLDLYSPTRAMYRINLKLQPLVHNIGDPILVTFPHSDLHNGRLLRIVALSEDMDAREVEVMAFG